LFSYLTLTRTLTAGTCEISAREYPALRRTATVSPAERWAQLPNMQYGKKIVLQCPQGLSRSIDTLIADFIASGVTYVGVVGKGASHIEDIIDWICVEKDGSNPYSMLTASHEDETLQDAILFAEQLTFEFAEPVKVVEFYRSYRS
jgi:hypothetical protein